MLQNHKWLLFPLLSLALLAQSKTTASLRGFAADASQARVSQARVVVINSATNARFETVTGKDGAYLLPFVTPGVYAVEVAKEGFAPWKRHGLELTVGQEATLDIRLDVATAQLEIDVTRRSSAHRVPTHPTVQYTHARLGPQSPH
jgi:hypothetical protein